MKSAARGCWRELAIGGAFLLLAACASDSNPPAATAAAVAATAAENPQGASESAKLKAPTLEELVQRELGEGDALLIGAGDIADCDSEAQKQHAVDTAKIIDRFPNATVFTLGDNAYLNGETSEFQECYGPSWGHFKDRTWPSPGNHDYGIYKLPRRNNADPYFDYFGANAGPKGLGYYSYNLGQWHLVSLNSMADKAGAPSMGSQLAWLKKDLAGKEETCVLAYWHHPLFSSGDEHGDQPHDPGRTMGPLWQVLRDHKAEVILNGHDHHYERFDRQDEHQVVASDGLQEFIVGTGGGEDRGLLGTLQKNSRVQVPHVYGVLLLTLHPNSYEWHFIDTDGTVRDWGSAECH